MTAAYFTKDPGESRFGFLCAHDDVADDEALFRMAHAGGEKQDVLMVVYANRTKEEIEWEFEDCP